MDVVGQWSAVIAVVETENLTKFGTATAIQSISFNVGNPGKVAVQGRHDKGIHNLMAVNRHSIG